MASSTKPRISLKVDPKDERKIKSTLERLLKEGRSRAPTIVKALARGAANSAAKLTIPNKGRNTPRQGATSNVRKPGLADKFRPVVNAKEMGRGNFYVINSKSNRKGKKRKKKRFGGFTGESGQSRVMRGSNGELVIYTTKKISQKDGRFTAVKKVIKAWDKKRRSWKWFPTMVKGKYDKGSKVGRIPHYFTAKMGWLWSARKLAKSFKKLNPGATKQGYMTDRLKNKDKPGVILHNTSNYAHKSRGTMVPRKALVLALRGYRKSLLKQKQRMIEKANRGS